MESHFQHVEEIFISLDKVNITIKLTKCGFFTQKVCFLRQIIEQVKLSIDAKTFRALKEKKLPTKSAGIEFLPCFMYRL